jgi:hypothetical protein
VLLGRGDRGRGQADEQREQGGEVSAHREGDSPMGAARARAAAGRGFTGLCMRALAGVRSLRSAVGAGEARR